MRNRLIANKLSLKIFLCILIGILSVFVFATPALACTGIYVGCDVSTDGSTIIGRSNDAHPMNNPIFAKVYGGNDGEKITQINSQGGFSWDLPEKIHRTITFPESMNNSMFCYCATAMNDCGLSINATVTAYCSDEIMNINPYVEGGISEDQMSLIVGLSCETAKQGIDLLTQIIDEKGSSGCNALMICDTNECWYMEIYGGHEYCAIKAPDDCVTVMGNEYLLHKVDANSPNVVCSKNLFSLPKTNNLAVYDSDGQMDIAATYRGKNKISESSHLRTWMGHKILSPSTIGEYSTTEYPLFYKPDKKISINEVMDLFRNRYENTPYSIDVNGKNSYRPICVESSHDINIIQRFKDLPANMNTLNWQTFSNAEFNIFVPYSNYESQFDPAVQIGRENFHNLDKNCAFDAFKSLNVLCAQNRNQLKTGICNYWKLFEKYNVENLNNILHQQQDKVSQKNINEFCTLAQNQAVYDGKRLFDEITYYLQANEDVYWKSSDNGKVSTKPDFEPYLDAVLISKMYGWNIEVDKKQTHNQNNEDKSTKIWGNPEEADNGGEEGYVKITKDNNVIEIHTTNSNAASKSEIKINGENKKINSKVYDGKTFIEYSFLNELLKFDNEYSLIHDKDISSARSYDNNIINTITNISSWPSWVQCIIVVFAILGVFGLVLLICRFVKTKTKTHN